MKRLVVRLSILSVVAALGLIAIAQARYGRDSQTSEEPAAAATDPAAGAPEPIRLKVDSAPPLPASGNPLRHRLDMAEPGLPSRSGQLPKARNAQGDLDGIPPASVVLASDSSRNQLPPSAGHLPPVVRTAGHDEDLSAGNARYLGSAPADDRYAGGTAAASDTLADDDEATIDASDDERYREPARFQDTNFPAADGPVPTAAGPELAPAEDYAATDRTNSMPPASRDSNPLRTATSRGTSSVLRSGRSNGGLSASTEKSQTQTPASEQIAIPGAFGSPRDEVAAPGRPGGRSLEGPQTPSITLIKTAPDEIQVGKECSFEILVRNSGQIAADEIEVLDIVPQGTKLIATEPAAEMNAGGDLIWRLGHMDSGAEQKLVIHLMPISEGDIGSVATVRFQAQASARTISTRPDLKLELSSPESVMIGEDIRLSIKLSNPGTGAATGVILSENIPAGMKHPAGAALEFEIGTLAPGEERELDLVLTAEQAGVVANLLTAQADANLIVESEVQFEVVAPALEVGVRGPKKRFLERPATYEVSVSNPGTAAAQNVEITTYLPQGMKFVSANNAGSYDPQSHSVSWGLEELPANQSGSVELVAVPVEQGAQSFRVEGKANRGLADQAEQSVEVEGVAAVLFTVADVVDPVEVGGETIYEITVTNQGSKASTNVQIVALLPAGMQPIAAVGPTRFSLEADRVVFAPLANLDPKADTSFQIKAKADRKGDQRIRVQLLTDEMQTPVTKEESTRVYADE